MNKYPIILLLLLSSVLVAWGQRADNGELKRIKMKVERLADLNVARGSHSIFYAGDELTVVGGHTSGFVPTATAEYYKDGVWHLIPTVYPHDNGTSVVLDGGRRVLIAGGHEKNLGIGQTYEAEMYYPETHTFDGFSCLDTKRAFGQGVELDNGQVLIVGNHLGNDAIELYDGLRLFRHYKDVSTWRSAPYILPISDGDAIVFGAIWQNANCRNAPYDTVDRLKGEPFSVPLLRQWMPLLFDQNSHTRESFIGDAAAGDFSYLIAAYDKDGSLTFIHIQDTVFTLLPTSSPLPLKMDFGAIKHISPSIADTKKRRAYILICDTASAVYVVAVEYDKRPAPITLYYADTIPELGNSTPVLTADGNLIVAGGVLDNNFSPLKTVWLLHVNEHPDAPVETKNGKAWLWVLFGLLLGGGVVAAVIYGMKSKTAQPTHAGVVATERDDANGEERPQTEETVPQSENNDNELMDQLIELMEREKLYLKPDLQVSHVADAIGVHRNTVSTCINSQQGCSFSQWVNDYRLQHAKKLLRENPDMKISVVGLNSGFANERSFFRSFKAATGMTPGEWAKKVES